MTSYCDMLTEHICCFTTDCYLCLYNLKKNEKKYLCIYSISEESKIECEWKEKEYEEKEKPRNKYEIEIHNTNQIQKKEKYWYISHFSCNKSMNSLAIVIYRNKTYVLFYLIFNENATSFETKFVKELKKNSVKNIQLTGHHLFVLVKKNTREKEKEKEKSQNIQDEKNEMMNNYGTCEKPSDKNKYIGNHCYKIHIFLLSNKRKNHLVSKIEIPHVKSSLKRMILCPYNETYVALLSSTSIVFCNVNKNVENVQERYISKEIFLYSPIVSYIWISYYIFVVILSNNQLLLFNFSNSNFHFGVYRFYNNYSKITSLFFKDPFIFISFTSQEIVCFKVNYNLIPYNRFKQNDSIEFDYPDMRYLFMEHKSTSENKENKEKNGTQSQAKKTEELKDQNIKKPKKCKETYKDTFGLILNEMDQLENNLERNNYDFFKNMKEDQGNSLKKSMGNNILSKYNFVIKSEDDKKENQIKQKKEKNFMNDEEYNETKLNKKKKKFFSNLNYDETLVIHILEAVSIINLQGYLMQDIYDFFISTNYLFILLKNGILYYTPNFSEDRMSLEDFSSFYKCVSFSIWNIIDVKIYKSSFFTLDASNMLRFYILNKESCKENVILTKENVKSFNTFSIFGDDLCLFISLHDGGFYFINMNTKKILLYHKIHCFFKKNKFMNKYIEFSIFLKVNDQMFNGYFKIGNFFIFFYLIFSVSHGQFFIYFIHLINLKKMFTYIERSDAISTTVTIQETQLKQKKNNFILFLNDSSSIYENKEKHYFCFLAAIGNVPTFYFLFFELPKNPLHVNEMSLIILPLQKKQIVYAKVLGSYLLVIDLGGLAYFFYLNDFILIQEHKGYIICEEEEEEETKVEQEQNELKRKYLQKEELFGRENFVKRIKRTEGSKRKKPTKAEESPSMEKEMETFFFSKKNRSIHKDKRKDWKKEKETTATTTTTTTYLYKIHFEREHCSIQINNDQIKYVYPYIEEGEEEGICVLYMLMDSYQIVRFSFFSTSFPLNFRDFPTLFKGGNTFDKTHSFYKICLNETKSFFLFLHKKKGFHIKEIYTVNENHKNSTNGEKLFEQVVEQGEKHGIYFVLHISYQNQMENIECELETQFNINSMETVFFKIRNALYENKNLKKLTKFNEAVTVVPQGKNQKKPLGLIISKKAQCFFDNEYVFFTFMNDNMYKLSLNLCVQCYMDRDYLKNVYNKDVEIKKDIQNLRKQLCKLIQDSSKNENVMLKRNIFFFDKKHINETKLLRNQFEKIEALYEKKKIEKQKIIQKLEKQCNVLKNVEILRSFIGHTYVTHVYKNRNTSFAYKNKIKYLRFLQLKERFYFQNIDKNNSLYYLKIRKDYIDEYMEEFASVFILHYYPCDNMNLQFLYSNLFNVNLSEQEKKEKEDKEKEEQEEEKEEEKEKEGGDDEEGEREQKEEGGQEESENESKINNIQWNYLLYYPFELFTNARKRIQCYVLRIILQQQKKKFHLNFTKLQRERSLYLKEIKFLIRKLKASLEDIEKYNEKAISHKIHFNLFEKQYRKREEERDSEDEEEQEVEEEGKEEINENEIEGITTINKLRPKLILKIYMKQLENEKKNEYNINVKSEKTKSIIPNQKVDELHIVKNENHVNKNQIVNQEPNIKKENTIKCKEGNQNEETTNVEELEIYEKKKNEIKKKISDIRNYIYHIDEQCEEFNEKLISLQKKKCNIHKLTCLHELYCISIYAILKNEEKKNDVIKIVEKKQTHLDKVLEELSPMINNPNFVEIEDESTEEKKKKFKQKYNEYKELKEALVEKRKMFKNKFLHECMNLDLLIEQKYENVIGYEFDSRKNIFLKKRIIQKHIMDVNQIILENFNLQQKIKKIKEEIYKNTIKNKYLNFVIMDYDESINDVKYLKQNYEFLSHDLNDVMKLLEKKKESKENLFRIAEEKMQEKIKKIDLQIHTMNSENNVLKENAMKIIKEINEIYLKQGKIEQIIENNILNDTIIEQTDDTNNKVNDERTDKEIQSSNNIQQINEHKKEDQIKEKKNKVESTKNISKKISLLKKKYR